MLSFDSMDSSSYFKSLACSFLLAFKPILFECYAGS